MRIIGGVLRGRKIDYSGDQRTRPMKDRVREAVFNLLGDVAGMRALDLFAGTGVLGFEALSRGASRALFLEQHFPTADRIRRSAADLDVESACEVVAADTLLWLRRGVPPADDQRPWLVFCSPPYDLYVSRRDAMLALVEQLWAAAPLESRFVVEADERFDLALLPEPAAWRLRDYPPARVGVGVKRM
ncbi:MAG TPA: RsmD family RNA methyltransferase [Pirellulales bacterium]|nr:RsmD family RNA methyltransferase [Pirellulales bacterium]